MHLTAAAFAALLVESSVGGQQAPSQLNPKMGVIFPANKALRFLKQCSRDAPGERLDSRAVRVTWPPTRNEITKLEIHLPAVLDEHLDAPHPRDPDAPRYKADDYYRQYASFIIDGRREIYVNGFHRSMVEIEFSDRRQAPALVCDGGRGFFGVEFDPATKAFSHFSFNGPF